MHFQYCGEQVTVFGDCSRTDGSSAVGWSDFKKTVDLASRFGLEGLLAFDANDAIVEPWLAVSYALTVDHRASPLLAVNPLYHHPFAVAKYVASASNAYGRRISLNLITGAANRDREGLGDVLDHDARYARLTEYGSIINGLLRSEGAYSYTGDFYKISNVRLANTVKDDCLPISFVAGKSQGADKCAATLGAVRLRMLPRDPAECVGPPSGVYLGLIARATSEEAWAVANARYPRDEDGELLNRLALELTDSEWKHSLVGDKKGNLRDPYWLHPVNTFKADCPFLVGSTEEVCSRLRQYLYAGVRYFIFDL